MTLGLVVMKWDERGGAEIITRYPQEIELKEKTLMQIYSTHEYTGEAGMISMTAGSINIASYYSGPESLVYVILLLTLDEDADSYEEGMADISRLVISNIDNPKLESMIPNYFQRLSVYPAMKPEQRLMLLYLDEVKRMVFTRLQSEGAIMKSEISVWLKDQFRDGFVEEQAALNSLIKEGLVKLVSIKGLPSEMIYLVNDLFMARIPPIQILNESTQRGLPAVLAESFRSEVKNFFANYQMSEKDNLQLMDSLLDPQNWEVMQLLRQAIVTRNDVEKLRKKGVEDPDKVLKILWENKMITVLRDDSGTEYYGIMSDFIIEKYFPEDMINIVRQSYISKTRNDNVLLQYIDVLKEEYLKIKNTAKIAIKKEAV